MKESFTGNTRRPLIGFAQEGAAAVLSLYMHGYHRLQVRLHEDTPHVGPFIALAAHSSNLDTVAAAVADPTRPRTSMVLKREWLDTPVMGGILRLWDPIPVNRDGSGFFETVRKVEEIHSQGRGICLAPEGTRSLDGRLQPLVPSAVMMVLLFSEQGVPIFGIVSKGAYEAFPKGKKFPMPRKITVVTGPRINLSPWHREDKTKRFSREALEGAGRAIREAMSSLLPEHQRPLPGTPVLLRREKPQGKT